MNINFIKMQANGNDFILLDKSADFGSSQKDNSILLDKSKLSELAKNLCRRRFSIGANGFVLFDKIDNDLYSMRIFNPDGSEAETCGNALLCIGAYIFERYQTHNDCIKIRTLAGDVSILNNGNGYFEVDMGIPVFTAAEVPHSNKPADIQNNKIILGDEIHINFEKYLFYAIGMGNPHAILICEKHIDKIHLELLYSAFSMLGLYPEGMNLEIVNIIDDCRIKIRVRERGAGETFGCGTGACAAAIAYMHHTKQNNPVRVDMKGGSLIITLKENEHVFMTGHANKVFSGEFVLEDFILKNALL